MADSSNAAPLRVAVAGLGTVGAGVIKLLTSQASLLSRRCGRAIQVTAVCARDRQRNRGVALDPYRWFDDPVELARQAEADVVVELVGGSDGPAKRMCEAALAAGRHVVTANKALLALHGNALADQAERAGRALAFEAAVAGGIPIVKGLREGLAANRADRVSGILNGTCNFILTQMRETGRSFDAVLDEAQQLGYAEADPTFDVDGIDAAHKLALLTALTYGCRVDFDAMHVEGIRHVTAEDIQFASELGYRIKLLGTARRLADGLEQRVHPCLVPTGAPIASVEGVFNAVDVTGDFVGESLFVGRGAGEGPTASAVVADLIDIARGTVLPPFGIPAAALEAIPTRPMDSHIGAYYLRLSVVDQAGVIADIAAAFRDEQVSVESLLQRGRNPGETVSVVLTTHETQEAALKRALSRIEALPSVVEPPRLIRIEDM